MERSARRRKSPKSIEQLKSEINSKNPTEIGITGLPIPKKKRSPAEQHEFETKRRKNIGTNVGGVAYKKDVNPYTNPRQRTFEEFMQIAEAMSKADKKLANSRVLGRNADALQQAIDAVTNGTSKREQPSTTRSGRKVTRQTYVDRSNVRMREETDVAQPPATKEEKRRIRMMQQLERLKRERSASRYTSDVATKEEYEIDEEQLDEIMKFQQERGRIEDRKKAEADRVKRARSAYGKLPQYSPPTKGPHAEKKVPTRLRSGSLPPERN